MKKHVCVEWLTPLMSIFSRAVQALAAREQKESQAPLGHLAPQDLQESLWAAKMDQLETPVSRDHQALMGSQLVHYKLPLKLQYRRTRF